MVTVMTTSDKDNNLLFNEEEKEKYLSSIIESKVVSESSAKSYRRIFTKTKEYEEILNKDLHDFSFEEVEKILYDFRANNRNTIESYGRIISSYFNWCVDNKIIKDNPLSSLRPEDFEKYLTNEEVYFSEKQLRRWENNCENMQDIICIRALFEGIGGRQVSELRNLRQSDIDWKNNRLHLIETLKTDADGKPVRYTERWVDVEQHTMDIIEGCINQKEYRKRNGQMDFRDNIRPFTELVANEYVVRPSITRTDKYFSPVDKHVIYRRIDIIADTLGVDKLTPKLIQRSGMLYYAKKIIGDSDTITLDVIKMVADRFNVKSYHNLKGFLTMENIKRTYSE